MMCCVLTALHTEQIQTQLIPCTIENVNDFISHDLLPGLRQGPRYHERSDDTHRLATQMNRKEPAYLTELANKRQAVDDLLKSWFYPKGSTQEYQIWVIIERTHVVFPDSPDIKEESDVPNMEDMDNLYLPSIDEILDFEPVQYPPFPSIL